MARQWLSLCWLLNGSEEQKLIQDFWCAQDGLKKLIVIEKHLENALKKCKQKEAASYVKALVLIFIPKSQILESEGMLARCALYKHEERLEKLGERKSAQMFYLLGKLYQSVVDRELISDKLTYVCKDRAKTLIINAAPKGHLAAKIWWAGDLYSKGCKKKALYLIKKAKNAGSEAGYYYWGYHLLDRDESR